MGFRLIGFQREHVVTMAIDNSCGNRRLIAHDVSSTNLNRYMSPCFGCICMVWSDPQTCASSDEPTMSGQHKVLQ